MTFAGFNEVICIWEAILENILNLLRKHNCILWPYQCHLVCESIIDLCIYGISVSAVNVSFKGSESKQLKPRKTERLADCTVCLAA